MPYYGVPRWEEIRSGSITDAAGCGKNLCVIAGTSQGQITKAGSNVRILGVTIEEVSTQYRNQEYCCDGVVAVEASEAIARLTSSYPTRLVSAANGRVCALPSTAGTYWVIGEMDNSSAASSAAGDIVHMLLYEEAQSVTVTGS